MRLSPAAMTLALFLPAMATNAMAASVTLDFDAEPTGSVIGAGTSITEDGFTVSVVSGSTYATSDGGNPGTALWVGYFSPVGIGDTMEIARTDGGLFTLDSFEFASAGGGIGDGPEFSPGFLVETSDGVNILGLFEGSVVGTLPDLKSNSSIFASHSPGFGPIDTLRFVGSSVGDASLKLDNFSMTTLDAVVPLPAAGLMLFGALGALVLARKRAA